MAAALMIASEALTRPETRSSETLSRIALVIASPGTSNIKEEIVTMSRSHLKIKAMMIEKRVKIIDKKKPVFELVSFLL